MAELKALLVTKRARFAVGTPIFERGPQFGLVPGAVRPAPGRLALCEIASGRARPVRLLGSPEIAADVIEALVAEAGMGRGFKPSIEREAEKAPGRAERVGPERTDLIAMPTFTIDPASARDFDDAVSAERLDGGGYRLWVHIADVAAHVRPGSPLDIEALRRATSVYYPGGVEPMIPHTLSSGACSLSAGDERLAVTTEIELSAEGAPAKTRFYRSRIRSDVRLDYEQIDRIFSGRDQPPPVVAEQIAITRELAAKLAERRAGSALEVSNSEPDFEFDSDGHVVSAQSVEGTESHRLIEQLMVLTNERVAEFVERRRVPSLYRVHEQPDPPRIEHMITQLAALDLPTPPLPDRLSPSQAGLLAAEASRLVAAEARRRGHGREAYGSLVLRSMKQAHYTHKNLGHAGLGSPAYAHFTSPIRRYPDLIAHRALLSALGGGEDAPPADRVREAGPHCSERERDAMKLERGADDICAAFLLERELFEHGWGTVFEGEVSGLIGAGAFIRFRGELADVYEGFLPARLIGGGERFDLDETEVRLVGRSSARTVRFGDPVTVRVGKVEAPRGRVDLVPSDLDDD